MRVLFASKLIEDRNFQPLGIYHLSASLKAAGHQTSIVDAIRPDDVLRAVAEFKPRVLAVSTPTTRYRFFQRLCREVKRRFPDVLVVVGGTHVTLVPETVADEGIDAVCRGEGDYALPDLVGRLEAGDEFLQTPGFWFDAGGEIVENPAAVPPADLDALPIADRGITDNLPYCRDLPVGMFVPSRGCPYHCTFCDNHSVRSVYGEGVEFCRTLSPGRTLEEIRRAVGRYGYSRLAFMSEVFGYSKSWLAEFVPEYRKDPGLSFWCMLHPRMIDAERAELLRDAGCTMAMIGIEAGNEAFRITELGRPVTNEQIVRGVEILHEYGIRVQATNILGLPGSSLKLELETLELNRKAKVDFPDVCIFQPLPDTPLTAKAIAMGLFDGDFDSLPATINPSVRRVLPAAYPDADAVEKLAFLFPLAARSRLLSAIVPVLIRLPLRLAYLLVYKGAITWYKVKFVLGTFKILDRQFAKILWNYLRY